MSETLKTDSSSGRICAMGCELDNCEKTPYRRGWCRMHYARWERHRDPMVRKPNSSPMTFEQVKAKNIPTFGTDGCWEWAGHRDRAGYGVFNAGGSPQRAHRYVYGMIIGPIEPGKVLRHSCDNPPCVNPAHLTPGTHMENRMDSVAKDRHTRGTRHRSAKLTEELVLELRRRYRAGGVTLKELANEVGLTLTPMSQAIRGVTWKHVPQP